MGQPAEPPAAERRDPAAYVQLICGGANFRPAPLQSARWLDPRGDYPAAGLIWSSVMDLSLEEWLGFWDEGYEYCGIFDGGRLVARAAAWRYSDDAWELAAVGVLPEWRRRGLGKAVCTLATSRILEAGRTATCTILADNVPMLRTAQAIGFVLRQDP